MTKYVAIGNGIYARTKYQPSFMEQLRAKQAKCSHAKRDPRGTCYECGHLEKEEGREDHEPECRCYCVGDQADASECPLHRG